ncbi:DNA primase [Candidatus Babeliales bacterium]|nr:DNA primase [Candidatus Babeliales bacterium]
MPIFNFVKSSLSILDVISEYVNLRQVGSYWKASCPFHHEKDASFTVSPDKQIFYCFGCNSGGDLISFIAKKENMSQIEAAKYLIDRYKLEIPDHIKKVSKKDFVENLGKKSVHFELCKIVADWAYKQLLEYKKAKEYIEERGISLKLAKCFKIGYFVGGMRAINNFLKQMTMKGILAKDLIDAGILMEGRSSLYSPFEERIIFPIADNMGRICGFGGRVFKHKDERARYYNSKESDWFSKGKLLFGLDLAKKVMRETSVAYLVEGYTDCIAMVKHGYSNTIATLGTACTQDHLKILSRYINTLYVLYDGDKAGQKAILRLVQLCWDVNLELLIVSLPVDEDPASYLNKKKDMESHIAKSLDIFSFFIEFLGKDFLTSPLSKKLELSEQIISLIVKLKDSFKRDILLQRASCAMQIPFVLLRDLILKRIGKKGYFFDDKCAKLNIHEKSKLNKLDEKGLENSKSQQKNVPLLEGRIFSAIINSVGKNERFYIDQDLIPYFSEDIQFLLQKFEYFVAKTKGKPVNFIGFLDSLDKNDRNWVLQYSLKFETDISKVLFDQLIFHFCKQNWKVIVQDMKRKLEQAKKQKDRKKLKELFTLFSKLKKGMQIRGLI